MKPNVWFKIEFPAEKRRNFYRQKVSLRDALCRTGVGNLRLSKEIQIIAHSLFLFAASDLLFCLKSQVKSL